MRTRLKWGGRGQSLYSWTTGRLTCTSWVHSALLSGRGLLAVAFLAQAIDVDSRIFALIVRVTVCL